MRCWHGRPANSRSWPSPKIWTVYARPELVVEVAFNDIQESPRYPGGLALRFARVKTYRPDKKAKEADTIDAVRRIFAQGVRGLGGTGALAGAGSQDVSRRSLLLSKKNDDTVA